MFGSHWYIDGAPGVRFCWLKEPTYVCRYAPGVADFRTVEDRLREAAPELADVAGGLGIEIGRVMNRGRRSRDVLRAPATVRELPVPRGLSARVARP
jgi:hypothetical protein